MTQHTTNSKELVFGDLHITVREMTVMQVRTWLSEEPGGEGLIDTAFFEDCAFSDLKRMSSLTDAQLDTLRPSQLREVIQLCKELNPDFFDFLRRLKIMLTARKSVEA
ncbi:hypothetical protein A6723_019905 [Pseudomonas sp. AU11447]|uniref:hypothetical protein n=1 Tax=Pseudomonas sp. AU11447 TaxID=1843184 RepID=UPI0007EC36F5|nr:hypothetical protein [Pseudomonas sp. AU11447]OBY90573.1 hypothetical protein A6723_019905 [Pseudomonas sp. AU11447]